MHFGVCSAVLFIFVLATDLPARAGPTVEVTPSYAIDLARPLPSVRRGELDLGGTGPKGGSIAVNDRYIERDGRPIVPILGEFHYCRYPAAEWEEALRKMKAGGITVVASYVFWNVHEREEGKFDWSGDLDLRRFVELVRRVGLDAIIRIGPFAHGEMRNGGLPDWLYGRDFEVRSNDAGYLAQVDKLYAAIAEQLRGLLYQDGGPVIGIQLENEFQHSAAPWEFNYTGAPVQRTIAERDAAVTHGGVSVSRVENRHADYGRDHLANLKLIAKRHGLDVPLYTATGWGNAAIVPKGSIPVTAGYPYPFWTDVAAPSPFYLFKDIRAQPDYAPVSFDPSLYPSLPAELGAGICPTYARRSYVPEESVAPMIVRVLGSGSNGVGYYMFHGGATPAIDGKFYNENASGLPRINYDYQAPLGEYGQVRRHFHELKLLHFFLQSFGEKLAPLPSILPRGNAEIAAGDTKTLRFAARAAEGSGFLFLLNFQDHVKLEDIGPLQLRVSDGRRELRVPSTGTLTLPRGASAILPVNLAVGTTMLRSATVQPLTVRRVGGREYHVFFSIDGLPPELNFDAAEIAHAVNCASESDGDGTRVHGEADRCFGFTVGEVEVLVVPRSMALQAWAAADGRLIFADAVLFSEGEEETLLSRGKTDVDVNVYPARAETPRIAGGSLEPVAALYPGMSAFRVSFTPVTYAATVRPLTARKFAVRFEQELGAANDVIMRVNYLGDTGMAFLEGRLIDDDFYFGLPWEIGLRRFIGRLRGKELVFVFEPMRRDASCLRDIPAEFRPSFATGQESRLEFHGVQFTPEYKARLSFR